METTVSKRPKKKKGLSAPPVEAETIGNLKKPETEGKKKVPQTIYLSQEVRKELKIASAIHDLSLSEIIEQGFKLWQERNGHA
jgi:hypothetical protein